ncbi:MAG: hypothetical protein KF699_05690 [Phycisphaeraceae bacterium]|nr:hypothetical protein [Phycisphaeraceae bacterium]MBX3407904.1 hypothetical protein [Phycisphaeraceae bacterium]
MRNSAVNLAAALTVLGASTASAPGSVIEIPSSISGGIHADGLFFESMLNYFVGYSHPSTPIERRNWFLFDLAGVGGPIVGGKLKLYLPGDHTLGEVSGYLSSDPSEDYMISGTPVTPAAFWDMSLGLGVTTPAMAAAIFGTLGSGAPYGLTSINIDHSGSMVEITLTPHAIADLNASIGGHFVIGGRLLDIHPDMPDPLYPTELVFAYTTIPATGAPFPMLELEIIPAPGSAALLAIGGTLAARRRRGG